MFLVGQELGVASVVTGIGNQLTVSLRDGSRITFNTDSEGEVRVVWPRVEVEVRKGEALFTMTRSSRRQLEVLANGAHIIDTGTVFAVDLTHDHETRITVEDGAVKVTAIPLPDTEVLKNQQATVSYRDNRIRMRTQSLSPEAIQRQLAWRHGRLIFDCARLGEIAHEFSRFNRLRIEIRDPTLAEIRFGGSYRATDPDAFLSGMVTLVDGIRLQQSGPLPDGTRVVTISRRSGATNAHPQCTPASQKYTP
jgi:transmembrane sensor